MPPEQLPRYLRTVRMGGVVDGIPDGEADRLVTAVAERMDAPRIDYVRLNIDARRA